MKADTKIRKIRIYCFSESKRENRDVRIKQALRCEYGEDSADAYYVTARSSGQPYVRRKTAETVPSENKISKLSSIEKRGRTDAHAEELPYVSITDCRNHWLIAFSPVPVGIDLQICRTGRRNLSPEEEAGHCKKLAERFFHPDEMNYVLENNDRSFPPSLSDDTDIENADKSFVRRFFQVWTAKEAYVKYTGEGIDGTFAGFSVVDPSGLSEKVSFSYPVISWKDYLLCVCVPAGVKPEISLLSLH